MPQLMPLFWVMSFLMVVIFLMVGVKLYNNVEEMIIFKNSSFNYYSFWKW